METIRLLLPQITIMLLIMMVGVLCQKLKIISVAAYKDLSSLLLFLINPLFIFMVFQQQEYHPEKIKGLFLTMGLSLVGLGITTLLSKLFLPEKKNPLARLEQFCTNYPNVSFFAIPLVYGMFGADYVFYLTGVVLVVNVLLWTHGVILLRSAAHHVTIKEISLNLLNPVIVASVLGFVCYVLHLSLPFILSESFDYLGRMNTPLAMLITGGALAQANLKKALLTRRIYYVSLLRLLLIPAVIVSLLSLLTIPHEIRTIIIIALSAPPVTSCVALAILYDKDPVYPSEIVAITTIMSILTIPVMLILSSTIQTLMHS